MQASPMEQKFPAGNSLFPNAGSQEEALVFLVYLFFVIFSNGIGAFRQSEVNLSIYFDPQIIDPSGNRNEVFCGGYIYYPDRPTITWTEDELGPAIFYHDRKLNEAFLSVFT